MLIWRHDYFACKKQKSYLLILSRYYFGGMITLPTKITSTHFTSRGSRCIFCGKRYCDCLLVQNEKYWVPTYFFFRILNFRIGIPIWWLFNSGIQKNNLTKISGIGNGIGIPLPMGVPEIGTKNQNSQPRWWWQTATWTMQSHTTIN